MSHGAVENFGRENWFVLLTSSVGMPTLSQKPRKDGPPRIKIVQTVGHLPSVPMFPYKHPTEGLGGCKVKKQSSAMLGKLNLVKLGVLTIVLCGLVTLLHLPRLHGHTH